MLIACLLTVLAFADGGSSPTTRSVTAVLVWWAILATTAFGLAPRSAIPRVAWACAGLLLALAVWAGLSATWAPSAERAFTEMCRILLYAGALVLPIVLARRGEAARWADGLAGAIALVAVLALCERLFPALVSGDDIAADLPAAASRLTYPVGYWNGLGIFLGLGVPLLLRIAVTARNAASRAVALAPVPVIAAAIYLTSSRGGAAVAVVGALTFVALAWHRLHALVALALGAAGTAIVIAVIAGRSVLVDGPFETDAAREAGAEAALLVLVVCAAVAIAHAVLSARLPARFAVPRAGWLVAAALALAAVVATDPAGRLRSFKAVPPPPEPGRAAAVGDHLTSASGSGRWQFWEAALDQFSAHPVAGGGAGSYESWWAQHGSIDWFVRNAHSLWLETLGELGLVGVVLLVAAFGVGLGAALTRLRAATGDERTTVAALASVVVAFALGAALDWIWQLPVVPIVAMACLGLLVGPATEAPTRDAPVTSFGGRAAVVLASWVAVIIVAIPFLSSEEIAASRRAAARGDLATAVERARSAQALEPWAASPRLQLALAYEELARLEDARGHIAAAIERDAVDWRLRVVDARLAAKAGDIPAARRALDRARSLNPRSQLLRVLRPHR